MLKALVDTGEGMRVVALPRAPHALHIMPAGAGYEIRKTGPYDWHGLRRGSTPFVVFQYTIAGSGRLRFGDRNVVMEPGTAMLLTVPHDHRYWLPDGGHWEFFWLSMSGAEAMRILGLVQQALGPVFRPTEATVDAIADVCRCIMAGACDRPAQASALGYQAAMALFDDAFGAAEASSQRHPAIARAIARIEADPGQPLPVGRLAATAGLSRAHFSRLFAEATGVPPGEYQLRSRLRIAARLISTDQTLSIKAASSRTGFADPNYFAKVFHRIYGVSPSEFRTSGMYFDQARPR